MSKRGMIAESKVVSPHVWLEGPLHPVCEGVIELVSLQITTSSPHVVFEAGELIHLQEQSVFYQEDFQYFKRGNKVYERSGWHEERTPITISMPGRPVFRSRGEIQGEVTEVQGCEKPWYEAPIINVTRPVLQQERCELVIGQISKGNQGLAMVAALAVGIASMGTATPAVMAAFLGEIGGTIASAMVASIASQTASSLVINQGNIKQVGKDLTSSHAVKSYMIAGASAGIMQGLKGPLDLPTQPKGFEQHLKVNLVRAGVSSSLNVAIGGCKPQDALQGMLRSVAAGTLGGLGANEIAEVYSDGQLDYLTHKLAHALLGAGMGSVLSKDIARGAASGAIGGFFGEMAGEELVERLGDKQLTTVLGQMDETVMKSQLAAAVVTALTGQDAGVATFVAENAIRNNSCLVKLIGKKLLEKGASEGIKAGGKAFVKKGAEQATKAAVKEASKEGTKQIAKKGAQQAGKAATKPSKEVTKLAKEVAKKTGGVKTPTKGEGYVVRIPNGKRDILVRIMEKGGERSTPYYRVTVNEKGGVTKLGEYSSNRHLTHIELHKNSIEEIVNIIKMLKD